VAGHDRHVRKRPVNLSQSLIDFIGKGGVQKQRISRRAAAVARQGGAVCQGCLFDHHG